MIELRDYQDIGVNDTRVFFADGGKHAILQAPTGAGKTVIFSYIAQNAIKKNAKVLILTDRTELLTQTGSSLEQFGVKPFFIRAGTKFINFDSQVYVAMCQTLRNRIKNDMWVKWIKRDIDLIIIDECHKQDFNYMFESGILDHKLVLGFTATPKRTGKMRQLALDYEKIIGTCSVQELIDKEYLVSDDYYGVAGVDLNNIKYDAKKGDYSESDMFSRFNSPKLYAGVVKNWLEVANNTHTVVFCVNIEHVIHTCEEFRKNGIKAKFLVSGKSKPPEPEKDAVQGDWVRYEEKMRLYNLYTEKFGVWSGARNTIINEFKNKDFQVLINAGILTTGFDCPDIETIIVNRATTSQALWLQMIGRGSRPAPFKSQFNILDFGDNADRLGHYTTPQNWELWHENKNTGDGVAPVKLCGVGAGEKVLTDKYGTKGCERLILAMYMICPFCGYRYPEQKIEEIDLQGLIYDTQRLATISVKKIPDMNLEELKEYYTLKKHKPAWLWRQLHFRGGRELITEYGKSAGWRKGTIDRAINYAQGI